ncbi:MAG TPA: prephenate dehydratase domain-containing protein, partial [Desulfobacteria bacterium]|nr:prephenate dehydratase domain-containing protein [Desulfobacteria bacterium]
HPIVQCLLTPRPLDPRHIERVYSHAQALGQCREFLAAQIPQAQQVICASTSEAARNIVSITENWAAIAPKRAASLYQLYCQWESIQDQAYNETRFVLVGRQPAELGGNDKTSLIVKTTDKPGALYLVLREFAERQINLTRIESRPSKQRLGEYIFFIDLEGHVLSPTVQEVLEALAEMRIELKLLGSYPKGNTVRQVTKHKSMQETV